MGPTLPLILAFLVWLVAFVGVRASGGAPTPAAAGAKNSAPAPKFPQATPAKPQTPPAAKVPAQPAGAATYAGDQSCLGCHEKEQAGYERSPHHWTADPRTPAAKQGCETCHGPGSLHVADADNVRMLNNFKTMTPAEINATCTTCHNRGEHALWDGSQHERRDVSCTSCHSLHKPLSDRACSRRRPQTESAPPATATRSPSSIAPATCRCAKARWQCSTCHNPHGSTNVKLLRKGDSIAETVHVVPRRQARAVPVGARAERDGCVTCHDPHGSSNERMLVAKPPILCQRCHVATRHPSTIYDEALIGSAPAERAHLRPVVRDLPREHSRIESPERAILHPVRGGHMRISRVSSLAVAIGLLPAARAGADAARSSRRPAGAPGARRRRRRGSRDTAALPTTYGSFDFGVRGTALDGDGARYERYRDLGDGLFLERVADTAKRGAGCSTWRPTTSGRRDQRFAGSAVRPGQFKAGCHVGSDSHADEPHDADALHGHVARRAADRRCASRRRCRPSRRYLRRSFADRPASSSSSSRRHIADGGGRVLASKALTVDTNVRQTDREGAIPFGGSFGHSSLVETPAPTEHKLTDVDAGAEYVRGPLLSAAATPDRGSTTTSTSLTFDNPFRVDRHRRGRHRAAAWRCRRATRSSASTAWLSYQAAVPVARQRLRVGRHLQDAGDPLCRTRSTPRCPSLPLDAPTTDGQARTSSVNLTLHLEAGQDGRRRRALPDLRLRQPDAGVPRHAARRLRQRACRTSPPGAPDTEPFGVKRAHVRRRRAVQSAATPLGRHRRQPPAEERTHRIFESTTDNTFRADVRLDREPPWFTLRSKYEHCAAAG